MDPKSHRSSVVGRSSSKWPRAVQDLLQIASAFQGGKLHLNCFKHVWCFEVNGGPVSYDDGDDDDDDDDDDHRGGGGGDDAINFALTHFQPCQHVKGNPSTSHVAFTFLKRPWPHPTTSLSSYSIHLVGFRFPTLVSHQRRCRIWRWVVVSIEPKQQCRTHTYIYTDIICVYKHNTQLYVEIDTTYIEYMYIILYIQHKFDCKQSGVQCFVTLKDGGSAENGGRNGANRRKGRASCGPYLRGCWVGLKSVSMAVGSRISFTLFAPAFSWLDAIANSLHGSSWHMLHTKCAETSYIILRLVNQCLSHKTPLSHQYLNMFQGFKHPCRESW